MSEEYREDEAHVNEVNLEMLESENAVYLRVGYSLRTIYLSK